MTEVHSHSLTPAAATREEIEGEKRGGRALAGAEHSRRALQIREEGGFALERLSDAEFDDLLAMDKKREDRTKQLIMSRLELDKDYGIPKDKEGRPVRSFKKPFCYKSGAEKIRKLLRWTAVHIREPMIEASSEWVSATVFIGIQDVGGRIIATATANCNTLEKRFRTAAKRNEGGQQSEARTYVDPREEVHNCVTLAFKRGANAATVDAAGATNYFANPEELASEEEEAELGSTAAASGQQPISDEQSAELTALFKAKGFKSWAAVSEWLTKNGLDGQGWRYVGDYQKIKPLLNPPKAEEKVEEKTAETVAPVGAAQFEREPGEEG